MNNFIDEGYAHVALSMGLCHYQLDGPEDGTLLLLIHGATVPAWEFDRLMPYLDELGYRTLRVDLYGHGYSDRPMVQYDIALFVGQMFELLNSLGIAEPIHVLGHSLGAAVGAAMACLRPQSIDCLVLAAPLVNYTGRMPVIRLLNIPVIGEVMMSAYVMPMLIRRRSRRYREIEDGRFVQKFMWQLAKPGFDRALLSLFRGGALGNQLALYKNAALSKVPTLILRGEHDAIVSREQVRQLADSIPHARVVEVAATAHAFMLTDPQAVAPVLKSFLGKCSTVS